MSKWEINGYFYFTPNSIGSNRIIEFRAELNKNFNQIRLLGYFNKDYLIQINYLNNEFYKALKKEKFLSSGNNQYIHIKGNYDDKDHPTKISRLLNILEQHESIGEIKEELQFCLKNDEEISNETLSLIESKDFEGAKKLANRAQKTGRFRAIWDLAVTLKTNYFAFKLPSEINDDYLKESYEAINEFNPFYKQANDALYHLMIDERISIFKNLSSEATLKQKFRYLYAANDTRLMPQIYHELCGKKGPANLLLKIEPVEIMLKNAEEIKKTSVSTDALIKESIKKSLTHPPLLDGLEVNSQPPLKSQNPIQEIVIRNSDSFITKTGDTYDINSGEASPQF